MIYDAEKLLAAVYSMNAKLDRIENAAWFGCAMLIAILLAIAFPEWRGIFG